MPRKIKRGYYVNGHFVQEGSELDRDLKAELKGTTALSKTELKRESDKLQATGEALLTLRTDLMISLDLPEKLRDALTQAKTIANFEGRRRHMQFIGKLMRQLEPQMVAAAQAALESQQKGSAEEKMALRLVEQWRDRLIEDDDALTHWLAVERNAGVASDPQQLRALIRQARKDRLTPPHPSQGQAVRHGRAYRELFQVVKAALAATNTKVSESPREEP